ncbi:MAG: hypothetical protein U0892_19220 [Pirellulales bacterium]
MCTVPIVRLQSPNAKVCRLVKADTVQQLAENGLAIQPTIHHS